MRPVDTEEMSKFYRTSRQHFCRFYTPQSPPTSRRHIRCSSAASKTEVQIQSVGIGEKIRMNVRMLSAREIVRVKFIQQTEKQQVSPWSPLGSPYTTDGTTCGFRMELNGYDCVFEFRADWLVCLNEIEELNEKIQYKLQEVQNI